MALLNSGSLIYNNAYVPRLCLVGRPLATAIFLSLVRIAVVEILFKCPGYRNSHVFYLAWERGWTGQVNRLRMFRGLKTLIDTNMIGVRIQMSSEQSLKMITHQIKIDTKYNIQS